MAGHWQDDAQKCSHFRGRPAAPQGLEFLPLLRPPTVKVGRNSRKFNITVSADQRREQRGSVFLRLPGFILVIQSVRDHDHGLGCLFTLFLGLPLVVGASG